MKFVFSLILGVTGLTALCQDKKAELYVGCIGFWNVENLYDTIDGPNDDAEFLPEGGNQWRAPRYKTKIDHLSEVISQMGTEVTPDGVAVLGLCEIETKGVLEDLVAAPKLKSRNYKIVHFDSPDKRGVDVALLYNPNYFKVTASKKFRVILPYDSTHPTRDILLVSGMFDGELMHFFVNHWPSRSGGEARSAPGRIAAARICRKAIDSLLAIDANAKIMLMGDLNDDPNNESVKTVLRAREKKEKMKTGDMFNASYENFKKGIGTLAYQDTWNLFDQMIFSPGFVNDNNKTYTFSKYKIFNKPFVREDYGNFKGYPFRTYAGGAYRGGYSDHFAVYSFLMKEKK
ncbi:MAG TPA: hypothetical protein VK177_11740 [Flavobacteriales bacterium]|nr:hypothetical protein [Flavobacteriales bacterium]